MWRLLIESHLFSSRRCSFLTLFTCGRGRIYRRYKELFYVLCSLQHIMKGAAACLQHYSTHLISTPPETLNLCCPFFLDVYVFLLTAASASPRQSLTRGLWLLQRVVPPVSPSFISLTLPFIVVPPVYDECHCLCPIQLA